MILVRSLILILLAGLLMVAPVASSMHVHDSDAPSSCGLCQTAQTEIIAGAAVAGTGPLVVDVGTTDRARPTLITATLSGSTRRRAPPHVV